MSSAPKASFTYISPSRRSSGSSSQDESSLDVLPAELQGTVMASKFAQIREQRVEARTVLRQAKQRTRNQQTDQQILLLMQADERLALLLSQAADSMRALLPPPSPDTVKLSPSATEEERSGAKAFEQKAQHWFAILNEVQYSLRSAVRYLRDAQLPPLTPTVGAEARAAGKAGAAGRGHSLSVLDAFVDLAGLEGKTFKLPPTPETANPAGGIPEAALSLQALREREQNWKALSGSLHQIHQGANKAPTPPLELSLLESIRNRGSTADRILIDALVNTN